MSYREVYREIEKELRAGRPVAQATVIQTKGSTPRKEGSTMLVRQDGSLFGTIGGGCGEGGVITKARLSLLDGKMREELADLTEDIALESEAVCGGTLRVFIEPWQPGAPGIDLAHRLGQLADTREPVLVHQVVGTAAEAGEGRAKLGERIVQAVTGPVLYPEPAPALDLPGPPQRSTHQLKKQGGVEVYTERWDPVPTLVIVGAGHIAEPLEALARMAGFDTVVVDDRRMFANRERFPDATDVIAGPILAVLRQMELSPAHYVVLVTRGHTLDMDALKVLLERAESAAPHDKRSELSAPHDKRSELSAPRGERSAAAMPVAYVGMIGSTRRIRAVYELLEQQGFPRERFANVHSPIGLNIAAETPAEIAISVMAEIVAVRRHAGDDTRPLQSVSGLHPSLRRAIHPAPEREGT
jgi:xanthine dehydrogenase accessory factor